MLALFGAVDARPPKHDFVYLFSKDACQWLLKARMGAPNPQAAWGLRRVVSVYNYNEAFRWRGLETLYRRFARLPGTRARAGDGPQLPVPPNTRTLKLVGGMGTLCMKPKVGKCLGYSFNIPRVPHGARSSQGEWRCPEAYETQAHIVVYIRIGESGKESPKLTHTGAILHLRSLFTEPSSAQLSECRVLWYRFWRFRASSSGFDISVDICRLLVGKGSKLLRCTGLQSFTARPLCCWRSAILMEHYVWFLPCHTECAGRTSIALTRHSVLVLRPASGHSGCHHGRCVAHEGMRIAK